jgi:hypothetical protein
MSYRDGIIMDEILAHIKSEKEGLAADIEAMQHDTMTECTLISTMDLRDSKS